MSETDAPLGLWCMDCRVGWRRGRPDCWHCGGQWAGTKHAIRAMMEAHYASTEESPE